MKMRKNQSTSYLLTLIIILCNLWLANSQFCIANTQLPLMFKSTVSYDVASPATSMMKQVSTPASNSDHYFVYKLNYPYQLLSSANYANIGSLISIQKLDVGNSGNSIHYRIKKQKSIVSLLLTFECSQFVLNSYLVSIILYSLPTYSNIVVGELATENSNGQSTIQLSALIPSTFKLTQASTLVFITGIKMQLNNPSNFQYEVSLVESLDLMSSKTYKLTVNAGKNTNIAAIYLNYIIAGEDQSNYEISALYYTFTSVNSGIYSQYIEDSVSSTSYVLTGLNSIRIKQGPSVLYYSFALKQMGQNIMEVQIKQPINILKFGVFRIGNTAEKLCKDCPNQKIIQNYGLSTQCTSQCSLGNLINVPNDRSVKCLICPNDLMYSTNSRGSCSCPIGFIPKNGVCKPQATNSMQSWQYIPSFTNPQSQCQDPNQIKNPQEECVCKSGYSKKTVLGVNLCAPVCGNGYYNGASCVTCPEGTFAWNDIQTCYSCGSYCSTCQSQYSCQNCKLGFELSSQGQCEQICGDGMAITTQCDDGNTIDGDGCSSKCKLEDGFNCNNGANSRTLCAQKTGSITRKPMSFSSGNLIIEYQLNPKPTRQYSQQQLSKVIHIDFKTSRPYQTYLVHSPTTKNTIRMVLNYGGYSPQEVKISVVIRLIGYNNSQFIDQISYKPTFGSRGLSTTFSRKMQAANDILG